MIFMTLGSLEKKHLFLTIIACLLLLGYYFPGKLWAVSNPFFMPLGVQLIFWALFLSLFFNKTTDILSSFIFFTGHIIYGKISRPTREIALFLITVLCLWVFRTRHFLWGDSHTINSLVIQFPKAAAFQHFLILALFKLTAHILHSISNIPLNITSSYGIWFWHFVAGGFFVVCLSRIADNVGKEASDKIAFLFLSITAGVILVFTHHELYAVSLVFGIWGVYFFIKYRKYEGWKRFLHIIPITLAFISFPLYISLLFLPLFAMFRFIHRSKYYYLILFVPILCYGILSGIYEIPLEKFFLPTNYFSYFISFQHFLTMANFLVFTSPVLLILLFKNKNKSDIEKIFFKISIASIAVLFLLNLSYGGLDWDLAASLLFPLSIFVSLRSLRLERRLCSIVVGIAILFFSSWLYLNIDNSRGLDKVENTLLSEKSPYLLEKSPQETLAQTYYFSLDRDKNIGRLTKYAWWCIENEPFRVLPFNFLIGHYIDAGKLEHAINIALIAKNKGISIEIVALALRSVFSKEGLIEQRTQNHIVHISEDCSFKNSFVNSLLLSEDSLMASSEIRRRSLIELYAIATVISFFGQTGKAIEARKAYSTGIRLYPNNPILHLNYSSALLNLKDYTGAREQLGLALKKGGDIGKIMNNIAIAYLYEGDFKNAEEYFIRATSASPMVFDINYNYALFLFSMGRKESAIAKMEEYIARAKYKEQKNLAKGAIRFFNSNTAPLKK